MNLIIRDKLKYVIFGLSSFFLVPLPFGYDDLIIIFFCFSLLLLLLYCKYQERRPEENVQSLLLLLCIPILLVSGVFSINISVVWFSLCLIICFISLFVILSSFFSTGEIESCFGWTVKISAFLFALLGFLALINGSVEGVHFYFGKGQNYITAYGCMLLPFVLLGKVIPKWFKVFFYFLLVSLTILLAARASFICVTLISIACYFYYSKVSIWKFVILAITSILLVGILILNSSEFMDRFEFSRVYNQMLALRLFIKQPLFGYGLGNIEIALNSISLNNYDDFYLYYNNLIPPDIHNQHSVWLVETGVFGLTYYLPVLFICIKLLPKFRDLSQIHAASLIALVSYLVLGVFYRTVNSDYILFSRIQLIYFVALAILSQGLGLRRFQIRGLNILLFALLMSALSIFILHLGTSYEYRLAMRSEQSELEKIQRIQSLYQNFGYKRHGHDTFLAHQLALKYWELKDTINADSYFKYALIDSENFEDILFDYSLFNLRLGRYEEAINLSNKLLEREYDYNEPKLILIEAFFELQEYSEVECYINEVAVSTYPKPYLPYLNYWNAQLDNVKIVDPDFVRISKSLMEELRKVENERNVLGRDYANYQYLLKKSEELRQSR